MTDRKRKISKDEVDYLLNADEEELYRYIGAPDLYQPYIKKPPSLAGIQPMDIPRQKRKKDKKTELIINKHRNLQNSVSKQTKAILSEIETLENACHEIKNGLRRAFFSKRKLFLRELNEKLQKIIEAKHRDLDNLSNKSNKISEKEKKEIEERKKEIEQKGRKDFQLLLPDIREMLCENWGACKRFRRYQNEANLAMAVGDVLATSMSFMPVATIATLIVKMGIEKFCECDE